MSYRFLDTHRFGEAHPFFVMETVPKDRIKYRPSQDVRSYTMQSPLLEDVVQRRLITFTPNCAILPNNWDKWYTNPVQGQDVAENVGTVDPFFWERVAVCFRNMHSALVTQSSGLLATGNPLTTSLRWLIFGEMFYSNGSLLSSLGIHGAPRLKIMDGNKVRSMDWVFDQVVAIYKENYRYFTYHRFSSQLPNIVVDLQAQEDNLEFDLDAARSHRTVSLRNFLSIYREDPSGTIYDASYVSGKSQSTARQELSDFISNLQFIFGFVDDTVIGDYQTNGYSPFNFQRVAAYQMSCFEYFTNDHVDYIYDGKHYLQFMYEISNRVAAASSQDPFFTVNGLRYYYDGLSGKSLERVLSYLGSASVTSASSSLSSSQQNTYAYCWSYISGLFSFRSSLRFKDYFTGSRTQPLAVDTQGDLTISSVSNVSVLDITRGIQKQRFLNAMNRAGRRMKDVVKELFDENQRQDYDHSLYLAEVGNVVYGDEVNNTGSDQLSRANSVTQTLRSANNNYEFDFDFDREGIILGINYYDIPRCYSTTIERQAFIRNRFDHFNPYLQFIGDQQIYNAELGNTVTIDMSNWSYTNRHMEWKQRYNQCAGGFVENLPGWSFIADRTARGGTRVLTPDYIRSIPSEFDIFFSHLTGYSLGSYFHFIVKTSNVVEASRPMAYAPSIL